MFLVKRLYAVKRSFFTKTFTNFFTKTCIQIHFSKATYDILYGNQHVVDNKESEMEHVTQLLRNNADFQSIRTACEQWEQESGKKMHVVLNIKKAHIPTEYNVFNTVYVGSTLTVNYVHDATSPFDETLKGYVFESDNAQWEVSDEQSGDNQYWCVYVEQS